MINDPALARVCNLIPQGQSNAISMYDLSLKAGLSMRAVRAAVHDLRAGGEPICSSTGHGRSGYFRPTTRREAEMYAAAMHSRLVSAAVSGKPVREMLNEQEIEER